jgi:Fe-S-cluster containining protein
MTNNKTFYCKQCGACCSWPGIVRITEEELPAIAAFLGLTEEQFIEEYTQLAPDRKNLIFIEREDSACVFLSEANRCKIHPVKPIQCQTFPDAWTVPKEFMDKCQGEYL